jgi:hypothetical protein
VNENNVAADIAGVERALRIADQQATAYAILRDRYQYRSRLLDIGILLLSIWLVAMTFVEPVIGDSLSPAFVRREVWIGLLSIGAFVLSTLQLLVDWKGRAQSYARSLAAVSGFVKAYRGVLKRGEIDSAAVNEALAAYRATSDSVEAVPEAEFLRLKQKHQIKMAVSQILNERPGRNITLIRLGIAWRDNFGSSSLAKGDAETKEPVR